VYFWIVTGKSNSMVEVICIIIVCKWIEDYRPTRKTCQQTIIIARTIHSLLLIIVPGQLEPMCA
jgi:hypothetical protein